LKDDHHIVDGVTFPSFRRLFVELEDLTEYTFATTYLDGWSHWKKIKATSWFQPFYEDFREELEAKVLAQSLSSLQRKAGDPTDKDSLAASKFLLSRQWDSQKKSGAGRPSAEKIKAEANKLFETKDSIHDDFNRLLRVV
jgi:hypothetical protein